MLLRGLIESLKRVRASFAVHVSKLWTKYERCRAVYFAAYHKGKMACIKLNGGQDSTLAHVAGAGSAGEEPFDINCFHQRYALVAQLPYVYTDGIQPTA